MYSMEFTNIEIYKYFISKFFNRGDVDIRILSTSQQQEDSPEEIDISSSSFSATPIELICLDGTQEDLFISFLDCHVSIFAKNQEVMFIDDMAKPNYTSSDTYGNVVYEGELTTLSKPEILNMLAEVVECFIDAIEIQVIRQELDINNSTYIENTSSYKYKYYTPSLYVLYVKNDNLVKNKKIFGNITINY